MCRFALCFLDLTGEKNVVKRTEKKQKPPHRYTFRRTGSWDQESQMKGIERSQSRQFGENMQNLSEWKVAILVKCHLWCVKYWKTGVREGILRKYTMCIDRLLLWNIFSKDFNCFLCLGGYLTGVPFLRHH